MNTDGRTRTCGLIGNPVEHSVSPVMHQIFASELEKNMTYVPFHVQSGNLEDAVKGAFALNILGCNVTVPYKSDVIPYLKEIDPLAEKIGAVNTLVRVENGFKGYNTDISGLLRAMKSENIDLSEEEVILLGAGGVARAVAFMCAANHCKSVFILNRSEDKAVALAEEVNQALQTEIVQGMAISAHHNMPEKKYLVIQCTNVGMYPKVDEAVIEEESFYRKIKTAYDLIFNPWETRFMKLAKEQGANVYNGLKMLLYQGVDAFELWYDCKIDDEVSRKAYDKMQEILRNE